MCMGVVSRGERIEISESGMFLCFFGGRERMGLKNEGFVKET